MRLPTFLAVVLVTGAIATSVHPQSAAQPAGQACSLLTQADAAAALGEAATGPRATSVPDGTSACEYTGSGIHTVHLNVYPLTAATAGAYKAICARKGKEGLTGLGDVTCWYNDKHGELQVLKGLTFYSLQLRRNGDPTEAIKALARKVYDRVK